MKAPTKAELRLRIEQLEAELKTAAKIFGMVAQSVLRSGGTPTKEDLMDIYRVCADRAEALRQWDAIKRVEVGR